VLLPIWDLSGANLASGPGRAGQPRATRGQFAHLSGRVHILRMPIVSLLSVAVLSCQHGVWGVAPAAVLACITSVQLAVDASESCDTVLCATSTYLGAS